MKNLNFGTYLVGFDHSYGVLERDGKDPFPFDNVNFHCLIVAGSKRSVIVQKVKTSTCLALFDCSSYDELAEYLSQLVNRSISFTFDNSKSRNVLYFEFGEKFIEISFS